MFVECLFRWLNIEITIEPIKTKLEKQQEIEDFKVTGIDLSEQSSTNKSAEELFDEDMKKSQDQLEAEINEEEPQSMQATK